MICMHARINTICFEHSEWHFSSKALLDVDAEGFFNLRRREQVRLEWMFQWHYDFWRKDKVWCALCR